MYYIMYTMQGILLVFIRDAILNHNNEVMKQLEAANLVLIDISDKHKEISEELELSTIRSSIRVGAKAHLLLSALIN